MFSSGVVGWAGNKLIHIRESGPCSNYRANLEELVNLFAHMRMHCRFAEYRAVSECSAGFSTYSVRIFVVPAAGACVKALQAFSTQGQGPPNSKSSTMAARLRPSLDVLIFQQLRVVRLIFSTGHCFKITTDARR
jgi:hypothetical protein